MGCREVSSVAQAQPLEAATRLNLALLRATYLEIYMATEAEKKTHTCTLQAVSQEVDWNIQKCLSSANVSSILEPNLLVETNTELKAHEEAGQGPEVQPWHH